MKSTSKVFKGTLFKSFSYYDSPFYYGYGAPKFVYSVADYGECPMDC